MFIMPVSGLLFEDVVDFHVMDAMRLTNNPQLIQDLVGPHFGELAGVVAENDVQNWTATYYTEPDAPSDELAAGLLISKLIDICRHATMALWLIRDNSANRESGYLTYSKLFPDGTLRLGMTRHHDAIFYYDTANTFAPVTYNEREVAEGIELLSHIYTAVAADVKTRQPNRVGRAWILTEQARMQGNTGLKLALQVTALEALLATDSKELAHKLAERTAVLLGSTPEERKVVYRATKKIYETRSAILHGDQLDKRKVRELPMLAMACDDILRRLWKELTVAKPLAMALQSGNQDLDDHFLSVLLGESPAARVGAPSERARSVHHHLNV